MDSPSSNLEVVGSKPTGPTILIRNIMIDINFRNISDEEFDWLVGIFLADGSKCRERPRTYRTYFFLNAIKDTKILEKLENILKKLKINYHKQIKKRNTLFVKISCKKIFDTMPDKKNSLYIPKNKDAFIAGFIDGDGFIDFKKKSFGFSQTIVKWIGPYISNYLKCKGIKPWTSKIYRNCFYYVASFNKVNKNTNIINFMACRGKSRGF